MMLSVLMVFQSAQVSGMPAMPHSQRTSPLWEMRSIQMSPLSFINGKMTSNRTLRDFKFTNRSSKYFGIKLRPNAKNLTKVHKQAKKYFLGVPK